MKQLNEIAGELKKLQIRERKVVRNPRVKALCVIDMLLTNECSDDKLMSLIYKIAHSAAGICDNPHEDWKKETQTLYRRLKRQK